MGNIKRSYWIDMAKFMAIIAVMIDHTNGLLYKNPRVAFFSYYSVSLFILIMGVTSYWSYSKYSGSIKNKIAIGCCKIIRPYLVATFIYGIIIDRQFHFVSFLTRIVHFNASAPFYYVLLYLQLMILSPILYAMLQYADSFSYGKGTVEVIGLIVILFLSSWTTNYSNILDVYGGGGKLFGGTYLILLYLGMLIGKHCRFLLFHNKTVLLIFFVLSAIMTILWGSFISLNNCQIDAHIPYGMGFNPPSLSLGLYAILMACTIYLLEINVSFNTQLTKVFRAISVLGKHTLYIFLYHRMFLDIVIPQFCERTGIVFLNIWMMRLLYFACMIGGSIVIEIVLERIHILLKHVYNLNCNSVMTLAEYEKGYHG